MTALPVIIAGAGPTGLSAAYHLGEDALLLEQNNRVGGWCRSVEANGFTFDYAGHIMFTSDTYVHKLYQMLLGDNVHWQNTIVFIDELIKQNKQVQTMFYPGRAHGIRGDNATRHWFTLMTDYIQGNL